MTRLTSAIYRWSYWGAIQSDSGGFLNSDHTIDFPALIALYYFTDFPWQADCQAQTAFIHCLLMIAKLSLYFLQIFYWSNKDPRKPFYYHTESVSWCLFNHKNVASLLITYSCYHSISLPPKEVQQQLKVERDHVWYPLTFCIIASIIRNRLKCCNNWAWTENKEALFATHWLTSHRQLWLTFGSGD